MALEHKVSYSSYLLTLTTLILKCSESIILRRPCETYANFNKAVINAVLPGPFLETFSFIQEEECKERCIKNSKCNSVNFRINGENTCQLSTVSVIAGEDHIKLIPKYGWNFLTSNYQSTLVGHTCRKLKPCMETDVCLDSCNCPGYTCHRCTSADVSKCLLSTVQPDCGSLHKAASRKNGIYSIQIDGLRPSMIKVYCDMETDNKGWTVIQRRMDNTDFDRLWDDYKRGFGNMSGSFWLGLENIHTLTSRNQSILRVEVVHEKNSSRILFAEYSFFYVGNEASNYILNVGGFQRKSTLPDALTSNTWGGRLNHNMQLFSTKDRENDPEPISNCAEVYKGGWWFNECYFAHLNGLFYDPSIDIDCSDWKRSGRYVTWEGLGECFGGILHIEMKIRNEYNN